MQLGLPVLTDVHTEEQATEAGKIVDVLQIPAFLCRQTDLIIAAAKTGKVVNVKKGQFLSPQEMGNAVKKMEECWKQADCPDRTGIVVRLQQSRRRYAVIPGPSELRLSGGLRCHP